MISIREKYIGSVLFFKHLFICFFLILILVPSVLCFYFADSAHKSNEKLKEMQAYNTDSSPANEGETLRLDRLKLYHYVDETQVEVPYYQMNFSDLYVSYPQRFETEDQKTVYLTFDDGPSQVTDTVLDVLAEKNIKATFFITGQQLKKTEMLTASSGSHKRGTR